MPAHVPDLVHPTAPSWPRRRMRRLRAAESLELLGGTPLGRLCLVLYGTPTIRPVNHVVEQGDVLFRTHAGSAVAEAVRAGDLLVAYAADDIDPATRLGWSVVVNGWATPVEDPAEAARHLARIDSWIGDEDGVKDQVIRIRPEVVFGHRVVVEEEDDG
ncbi:Pyridoxamine 5'-phosphate oxidase [Thermomonospora echinospora]|uniref:Pyridoxamine 5'-phosphate oxidase n=1 Tax=Thermomonospora echinospora TaxID=1992 RepID=A0A1H5TY60_9ACTN|nr:pyridoxamine 5'-phosphate oxidase family protein [Thermomonospora echinospora]SEF66971.1 Pyridoxamine 5'-phosphate oxidase [Thermomonospora echinospora]